MALKGIEEEIDDSENEDESEDEDEDDDEDDDLTFIANEINKDKSPRKSKSSRKGKSEKPFIQCHECKGFGYMRIECLNYLIKENTKK